MPHAAHSPAQFIDRLPEAFREWLGGRRVEEVECVIADIAGVSRGKAMPYAKFVREDRMFLPTSIYHQTIAGDYVDMDIANQWNESDMVLRPDYAAAAASPWADDVTLQVIHNAEDLSGRPIAVAPRNVLKRVVGLYEKEGWRAVVAPEMEFYLIKPNLNPNEPIEPPVGRTGRQMVSRQAYSMSAVDEYGKVIDDIYEFAEAQGFEIDTIIQEGGAGQVEINLLHGDPVALADQVFFFKRTIREAALRNNCFATFMAKPMQEEPGSAMHIHQSVVDAKTGREHLHRRQGGADQGFLQLPRRAAEAHPDGGLHAGALCEQLPALRAERLGADQPRVGAGQPHYGPQGADLGAGRAADREPGGGDGLQPLSCAGGVARLRLSRDEGEAQAARPGGGRGLPPAAGDPAGPAGGARPLRGVPGGDEVLGVEFCNLYKAIKRDEVETFLRVISPWERDHLLLNV